MIPTALGAVAGLASTLFGQGKKVKLPSYTPVDLDKEQQAAIAGNLATAQQAEALASRTNAFNQSELMKMLEAAIPGYRGMTGKISQNISNQLAGNLPSDVQKSIQRMAASRAVAGGYGGTGMGRNLEMRDLGLTSYQASQQALANAMQFMQIQRATTVPDLMSSSSMFISPLQRAQMAIQQNQFAYQAATNQAMAAAQPSPTMAALSGTIGSLGGIAFGAGLQNMLDENALNRQRNLFGIGQYPGGGRGLVSNVGQALRL